MTDPRGICATCGQQVATRLGSFELKPKAKAHKNRLGIRCSGIGQPVRSIQ
jgi:hypothetical protein